MAATLPVSLVISTYEEGASLRATVDSVLDAAERPAQILIVDDGSTDGSTEGGWPTGVAVLRRPHRGIAPARNAGAEAAAFPVLVFLDAHCAVDSAWLRPLCEALAQSPCALVGPAVADSRDPRCVGCGATLVDALFSYRWNPVVAEEPVRVQIVPGGCLAVRRDVFLAAGGFGDFAGFGLEDVDLALNWHAAGHPLLGVPRARVRHCFRTRAPYPVERQHWIENLLQTAFRHLGGERLRQTLLACAAFPGFVPALAAAVAQRHGGPGGVRQARLDEVLARCGAWKEA